MMDDLEFLVNVVKEAGLLIDNNLEIMEKGSKGDLVTNFDYKIEQFFINKIKDNYPQFSIVSEELNSEKNLTKNCFVIDPIDGTANFANNIPLWGIQIACVKNSKTCASVIYLPLINELYYADKNGAFLNGKAISVNNLDLNKGIYTIEGSGRVQKFNDLKINKFHYRCYNSSSVSFAWVASGKLSATMYTGNHVWDYMPGQYIVEQAGGVIYNDTKMHIAANSDNTLQILKTNSSVNSNE